MDSYLIACYLMFVLFCLVLSLLEDKQMFKFGVVMNPHHMMVFNDLKGVFKWRL